MTNPSDGRVHILNAAEWADHHVGRIPFKKVTCGACGKPADGCEHAHSADMLTALRELAATIPDRDRSDREIVVLVEECSAVLQDPAYREVLENIVRNGRQAGITTFIDTDRALNRE